LDGRVWRARAAEDETREEIISFYRRAWEHSDAELDTAYWEEKRAKIERAAQAAASRRA